MNNITGDANLSQQDLSILKYYKEGDELCGFEGVHNNLCKHGYLDSDLELTTKARRFLREYDKWDTIESYNNKMYLKIHPKLN
jgi:hypothetical protein